MKVPPGSEKSRPGAPLPRGVRHVLTCRLPFPLKKFLTWPL